MAAADTLRSTGFTFRDDPLPVIEPGVTPQHLLREAVSMEGGVFIAGTICIGNDVQNMGGGRCMSSVVSV